MHTKQTIRTLNHLVRTCRGTENLLRVCADGTDTSTLRVLLQERSQEWGRNGDELQALVLLLGGVPATTAGFFARLSGARALIKSAALGPADPAMVVEWQGAQDRALQRYETALQGYLPERIRRTLTLQMDRAVRASHYIGQLRERYEPRSHAPERV
jgi:uncharacterized protein (TIGR02284 family)